MKSLKKLFGWCVREETGHGYTQPHRISKTASEQLRLYTIY